MAWLLKAKEAEIGKVTCHRVRIVQRNGERLEHLLTKSDPFGDSKCSKESCLLCLTSEKEKGMCKKTNMVYKIECLVCKSKGGRGFVGGRHPAHHNSGGGGPWKA